GEQPGDAVAVGAVAGRRDGHRAGRVRGDHLHLDALGRDGRAATEVVSRLENARKRLDEPRVDELEVDEAWPGDRGLRDAVDRGGSADDLLGYLTRRPSRPARELQRDAGGVVAV